MRDILVLICGKILGGILVIITFALIRNLIGPNYILFSTNYAYLILLTTVTGGALSGLLLNKSISFDKTPDQILLYSLLFILFSIIIIEICFFFSLLPYSLKLVTYFYILTFLLYSITLVNYQIEQKFLIMTLIDISRVIIPLIVMFCIELNNLEITYDNLFYVLSSGNLLGNIIFFKKIKITDFRDFNKFKYLKNYWKSDLTFIMSFASFNWLIQLLTTFDRTYIAKFNDKEKSALIAYTADQVTKLTNGLLFPLNTKISSQIGTLMVLKKFKDAEQLLKKYTNYSIFLSIIIILTIYPLYIICKSLFDTNLDTNSIFYYTVGNSFLMICLINQKRFDFTHMKPVPALLLAVAIFTGIYLTNKLNLNFYALTNTIYTILLFTSIIFYNKKINNALNK